MKKPARSLQRGHRLVARFQGGKRRLLSQGPLRELVARAGKGTVRLDHGRAPSAVAGLTFHNHACHGRDTHGKPAGQLQEGSDRTLYYCQPCYDKGVKSVLRYSPADSYGYARWICVEHGGHNIGG